MTLPNFLIIGAPKAGTTTLYDHFRAHPEIFMPRVKEAKFFSTYDQDNRRGLAIRTLAEYEALFDEATTETAIGEASPHYLMDGRAAARIRETLPDVRMIASLRNPVDRAYSIFQMNQRDRGAHAGVAFGRAIETDRNLQETYADRLERYFAQFPRGQIRIILLEDLETAPRPTLQSLFDFLGVDPDFEPDIARVSNPGGAPRVKLLHGLLTDPRLRAVGRSALPTGLTERLKALRSRNLRKTALPAEDRRKAVAFFRDDILKTQEMIGRDLSAWLAT